MLRTRHPKLVEARKMAYCYVFLFPVIAYFILFHYRPMYGILIAFKDFRMIDGIMKSPWVGLKYFKIAFGRLFFWRALRNTVLISLYQSAAGFFCPIVLALLLNEVRQLTLKKTIQTISYLPHFMSWVVLAELVRLVLSPSYGPVNHVIKALGGQAIHFVADAGWFRSVLVWSGIWHSVGWGSIVYLAAIATADPELYEAAEIDGAGRFSRARHVTIPAMVPTITILLILNMGSLLDVSFDQVFNLYSPSVYEVGDVLGTYIYRVGIERLDYSEGTAVGLLLTTIGFLLVLLANAVARRSSENALW